MSDEDRSKRVADRYGAAVTVLIRNVAGHDWGWFSREDSRMHVQTVDEDSLKGPNKAKAWLETAGKRTFEPAGGKLSGSEWKKLEAKVRAERDDLESKWSVFMVKNHWLKADLKGSVVTLTAYPGMHNAFTRTFDLQRIYPGAYPYWDQNLPKLDLESSPGLLAVGPNDDPDHRDHLELTEFLFIS
ncbi:MAG: hypothetical protein ABSF69_21680 [Polyangiaceae bacterium]|jgi:hypothetical protein